MNHEYLILLKSPQIIDEGTLWIEDNQTFINSTIKLFSKEVDSNLHVEKEATKAMELVDENRYSSFLIDLDLEGKLSGIDLIRSIKSQNSLVPIRIVSAKASEPEFELEILKLEEEFDTKIPIWEKPFNIIHRSVENKNSLSYQIEKKIYNKLTQNPFKFSVEEFRELSFEQLVKANEVVFELVSDKINSFFNKSGKSWVGLGEKDGEIVILVSSDVDQLFNDQFVDLHLNTFAVPVFFIKKPKLIEEIKGSKWFETNLLKDDYYPSIELLKDSSRLLCHFDTGNPYNFLSFEQVLSIGMNKKFPSIGSDTVLGQNYNFCEFEEEFEVETESGSTISIKLVFEGVIKWKSSIFCKTYKNRIGLLGRKVLLDNKLEITLDGKNKKTKIK